MPATFPFAPDTDGLLIGKGVMLFNPNDPATGLPTNWWHFGNTKQVSLQNQDQVLELRSSMNAGAAILARRLQSRQQNLNINLMMWSRENLRIFVMGTAATYNQAATPIVAEVLSAAPVIGAIYPVALKGPISAVSVDRGASPLVLGTDYTLDPLMGFIQLLDDAGTGDLTIDYTPTAVVDGDLIRGGTLPVLEGQARFIGDPSSGPRMQFNFHKVSINPEGVLNLISEEYAEGVLSAAVLDDSANNPTSPFFDVVKLP